MATKRKWTDEENSILVQAVTANPHNIKEACRYAATRLKCRTSDTCYDHWYRAIAPANNPTKSDVIFLVISSKTIYKNRKNSGRSTIQPEESTLQTKIKTRKHQKF